jgi:hypothetical protein
MRLTIPVTTIKLILLTAVLWSTVSIFAVVALCSIGYVRSFYVIVRPTWVLLTTLAILWFCSLKVVSYGMFRTSTFYTPLK